jgi:hypothetical protein
MDELMEMVEPAEDKRGALLDAGERVHVASLGTTPQSCGVILGVHREDTRRHGETWLLVEHGDGERMSWPAHALIRDAGAARTAD